MSEQWRCCALLRHDISPVAQMEELQKESGCKSVVRTMPNTPAMIGQGMTVWSKTESVTDEQAILVQKILRAMGEEIFVQVTTRLHRVLQRLCECCVFKYRMRNYWTWQLPSLDQGLLILTW